jgi:DNA invertase Pin-like site-specific DNA recombinase
MKIASIYARESSDDTNKAPPIEKQIEIGKQWCLDNGYELKYIFQDDGYSGGDWNRPEWKRAIQEAKGKHYNVLWTWNQDRIARDTEQFLWFFRNLKENSIRVFCSNEEINMDDVGGMAKHTSLAMASEIFRRVTSEKVKRTYDSKKKQAEKNGKKVVWGRKPKEYDLQKILELRKLNKGWKAIAKEMGCSHSTIRRIVVQNTPQKSKGESTKNIGGSE